MPTTDGAGRLELRPVNVSGLPDCGGVEGVVGAEDCDEVEIGYGMLPFEFALSYASAVLAALRTQTATRALELALPGLHVHWLFDVHCCMTIQFAPSKIHHLYW
jgi:hypothetical protein